MTEKKTTVIVVAYNHADYVVECLESIRAQSRPAAEVLIADDCSPDGRTVQVIRDYLEQHPGFGTLHANTRNMGLTRTLNAMLAKVTTEYVTYIAADDLMASQRIETHQSLLDAASPDVPLAYSDATVIDKTGAVIGMSSEEFPWPEEPARSESTLEQLVRTNWIPAASMFMRTRALTEAGGYAEDLFYEDIELLTRLARHHRFTYSTQPLVAVRRLDTSLGAVGFDPQQPRFLRAQFVTLRNALGKSPELDTEVYRLLWETAVRARRIGSPRRETIRMTLTSLRGAPSLRAAVYRTLLAFLPG